DGRQETRGHGYPMPVWGKRFEMQAESEGLGTYGSEAIVRGRILSIAYYLESIQE
ncbi:MAG: cytochrome c, partial [Silicimonas sp.]|nr:cytochrome c [Silicimonas sp.]